MRGESGCTAETTSSTAAACTIGSFTEADDRIDARRAVLTARRRTATVQVGSDARPVPDVAAELGGGWHAANRTVVAWGEVLLGTDAERVGPVRTLGLDETLFGYGPADFGDVDPASQDAEGGQALERFLFAEFARAVANHVADALGTSSAEVHRAFVR